MSSAAVGQRLNGASTGLPDDTPLCYVELTGDFTFSGPPGAEPHFARGFEVFDAKTGNLLLAGGLPGAAPTDSSR